MKITKKGSIFNGISKEEILEYLNQNPENLDCPVMLYAADDFDDFIATLKDIEVQHNIRKDENSKDGEVVDIMWNKFNHHIGRDMKEDEAKELFVKQCKEGLKVKDFIEKLNEIKLDEFQITASTEGGRIYFLVTDLNYHDVNVPGLDKVLMLDGNF